MDDSFSMGLYQYKSKVNHITGLPDQLRGSNMSACSALIELLIGKVEVYNQADVLVTNQVIDYYSLPAKKVQRHSTSDFNAIFGVDDITDTRTNEKCNAFLRKDRRNNYVYEHVLDETTQYFAVCDKSPCEGFVHLYRLLEFMSYSFPLMYVSTSNSYKGSYDGMKKFFNGDKEGELKFFERFLTELFSNDPVVWNYTFDVLLESDNMCELKSDLNMSLSSSLFALSGDTLQIKFKDVQRIFIEVRNRYFHMLVGQGTNNFLNVNYDKNELFRSFNPAFINWIAYVFITIVQRRFLVV